MRNEVPVPQTLDSPRGGILLGQTPGIDHLSDHLHLLIVITATVLLRGTISEGTSLEGTTSLQGMRFQDKEETFLDHVMIVDRT